MCCALAFITVNPAEDTASCLLPWAGGEESKSFAASLMALPT